MQTKWKKISIGLFAAVVILLIIVLMKQGGSQNAQEASIEILPVSGSIQNQVSTTGVVKPQNRLEIKPPIGGRIEEILVKEGEKVKRGDILALMSSTERATLLDAAHLRDAAELEYWKKVYNATPLIAPIDGEVIVRAVEPGQTVVVSDAVIVLSDRLIVKADVDETDIGKVKVGRKAMVSLDAYPEIQVEAIVDHISYESTVVNNVTIYEVDILPETIPEVFRSGMSANVEIITESRDNVLLIPIKAVKNNKAENFVVLKQGENGTVKQKVQLGLSDDVNVEIISGLSSDDTIIVTTKKYLPTESKESEGNPFMPKFDRKKR
ncbi:MAG: efflux RND transporter periplasmic adaptor subunit [Desulfobacterales bacterium]|nr:efflux RND transporter periplasmic adaptor subunit [Desulfobacterales bacterium]